MRVLPAWALPGSGRAARLFGYPAGCRATIDTVPESAAQSARRKALAREAARRREAVTMLQVSESTCRYAASVLANGADPAEARATALFVAGELVQMAESLRRLTRLDAAGRRVLATQLAALGWTRRQIAARLGVSERAVFGYLRRGPNTP